MKKQLHIKRCWNSEGFIFPYAIFISMLVLLNITTIIMVYDNQVHATYTMNEFVEAETLIQMSKAKFVNDNVYNQAENGEVIYEHPNGQVHLSYTWIEEKTVEVTADIQTVGGLDIERDFKLFYEKKKFADKKN